MFPALNAFYIEVNNPVKITNEDNWRINELLQSAFVKTITTRYTFSTKEAQEEAIEIFSRNKNALFFNKL